MSKELPVTQSNEILFNQDKMLMINTFADAMASSAFMVPEVFQGNRADCFLITLQAIQWGLIPTEVARRATVIKGNLCYESKLVSTILNKSNILSKPLEYEHFGEWERLFGKYTIERSKNGFEYPKATYSLKDEEGIGVCITAYLKGQTKPIKYEFYLSQAFPRHSTLWATDPKTQIIYTGTRRMANLYFPELFLGFQDKDDVMAREERDITPEKEDPALLHQQVQQEAEPEPKPEPVKPKRKVRAKAKSKTEVPEFSDFQCRISMSESASELKGILQEMEQMVENGALSDGMGQDLRVQAKLQLKQILTALIEQKLAEEPNDEVGLYNYYLAGIKNFTHADFYIPVLEEIFDERRVSE